MALAKPTQITVPFSSNGVKNTIPETATGSNLASMQEGFPVITMTDVDQGGMPPQGQDMNGILFNVTKAIQYQQAGGLFPYDATFASKIDGYPIGALLTSADGTKIFQNMIDGNQSDPENGGQNWNEILTSTAISGKQDALNAAQLAAVNSGITAAKVAEYDGYATGKQDTLTFDNTPTEGSLNPVTSDGIATSLSLKQDNITVDAVPTSGSTNPVQSGGVYDALAEKVDIDNAGNAEVVATGSTESRTLADRFADVVNVKDFGAKGDGTTDDTQAIQDAINTRKNIYFPTKSREVYLVSGTLTTTVRGQCFFGDPNSITGIDFSPSAVESKLFDVIHPLVRFSDLRINSKTELNGIAISAQWTETGANYQNNTDLSVNGCDITGFKIGVRANSRSPTIIDSGFAHCSTCIEIFWVQETYEGDAISELLYGNATGMRGIRIENNLFHHVTVNAINISSGNPIGAIISGNRFDYGWGRFLIVNGVMKNSSIDNNQLFYTGSIPLQFVGGGNHNVISNNVFRGSDAQTETGADRYPETFIRFSQASSYNTITGNTFECCEGMGIYFRESLYDTVIGNSFLDISKGATSSSPNGVIFFSKGATGTVVTGNTCEFANDYVTFIRTNSTSPLKDLKVLSNTVSDESKLISSFSDQSGNEIGSSGLLVTATGSTTARTLANRFADVINVKDFGAKGDGVTDDTSAIASAMSAASGKTVYFPDGVYACSAVNASSPIDMSNNAILKYNGGTTNNPFVSVSANGLRFGDIYINCNNQEVKRGIQVSGDNNYFRSITVLNENSKIILTTGIYVIGNNNVIDSVVLRDFINNGYNNDSTPQGLVLSDSADGNIFYDVMSSNCRSTVVNNATGTNQFGDVYSYECKDNGFYAVAAGMSIIGNVFYDGSDNAMGFRHGANVCLGNLFIKNFDAYGVFFGNCGDVSIGNIIVDAPTGNIASILGLNETLPSDQSEKQGAGRITIGSLSGNIEYGRPIFFDGSLSGGQKVEYLSIGEITLKGKYSSAVNNIRASYLNLTAADGVDIGKLNLSLDMDSSDTGVNAILYGTFKSTLIEKSHLGVVAFTAFDTDGSSIRTDCLLNFNNAAQPNLLLENGRFLASGTLRYETNPQSVNGILCESIPTGGSWQRGQTLWNVNAAANAPAGWICVASGTPGSWVVIPTTTA